MVLRRAMNTKKSVYTFSNTEYGVRLPSAFIRRACDGMVESSKEEDQDTSKPDDSRQGVLASKMGLSHMECTFVEMGTVRNMPHVALNIEYFVTPGDIVEKGQPIAQIIGKRAGETIFQSMIHAECEGVIAKLGENNSIHLHSFTSKIASIIALDERTKVYWLLSKNDLPSRGDIQSLLGTDKAITPSLDSMKRRGDLGVFIGGSGTLADGVALNIESISDDSILMSALASKEMVSHLLRYPDDFCLFHAEGVARHRLMEEIGAVDLLPDEGEGSTCFLTEENGFLEKVCMTASHPHFLRKLRFIAGGRAHILVK